MRPTVDAAAVAGETAVALRGVREPATTGQPPHHRKDTMARPKVRLHDRPKAEKARFLAAVERGIEAADRGEFASPERMRAMFAKWGVDAEA